MRLHDVPRRTCTICKERDYITSLVMFQVRRYAHGVCLYRVRGRAAIDALPTLELGRLGVLDMLQLGYDVIAEQKRRSRGA